MIRPHHVSESQTMEFQAHLSAQLTCSTLMSISPWIFFPLKYFALERNTEGHIY